jgi:TolA-binding protein
MIDLLGKKLVALIMICLLAGAAAGGAVYFMVMPAQQQYAQEASSLRSRTNELQAEIDKMRFEFDQIQKQIDQFRGLERKGFFTPQDRITTREAISSVSKNSGLIESAVEVSFAPAQVIKNANADKAGYQLVAGPMKLRFGAMSDVNVFRYILTLQRAFPGYLQFKSFQIQRDAPTEFNARVTAINSGQQSQMVSGSVDFMWWTMASEEQLKASPLTNPTQVPITPETPPGGTP